MWGPEPISARRLAALAAGLPHDGAFSIAVGAHTPGWGAAEELAAFTVEKIDESNRLFVAAHSKKGTKIPDPLKIPRPRRPGELPKRKRQATSEEMVAFFGAGARYTGPKTRRPSTGDGSGNAAADD